MRFRQDRRRRRHQRRHRRWRDVSHRRGLFQEGVPLSHPSIPRWLRLSRFAVVEGCVQIKGNLISEFNHRPENDFSYYMHAGGVARIPAWEWEVQLPCCKFAVGGRGGGGNPKTSKNIFHMQKMQFSMKNEMKFL